MASSGRWLHVGTHKVLALVIKPVVPVLAVPGNPVISATNAHRSQLAKKPSVKNGVWPTDSCKTEAGPSTEICNGIDDDCDGKVDEAKSSDSTSTVVYRNYYKDDDKDGYGAKTLALKACSKAGGDICFEFTDSMGAKSIKCQPKTYGAGNAFTYVRTNTDCNDKDKDIKPGATDVCDGVDNDCDNSVDEGNTKHAFYYDDDADGERSGNKAFNACYKKNSNNKILCKGANSCVDIMYNATSGASYIKYSSTQKVDCCDSNKDVNHSQTAYFDTAYTCNGKTSFDYNCDGNTTPEVGLCQCASSVKYTVDGLAACRFGSSTYSGWVIDKKDVHTHEYKQPAALLYRHDPYIQGNWRVQKEKNVLCWWLEDIYLRL